MRKLFLYYLKKRKTLLIVLSSIFTLYTLTIIEDYNYIIERSGVLVSNTPPIYLLTSFAIILVIGIPIYEFNFKMKKIDIDEHYKLPIKREKLFITKYLIGLVEVIIPLTIAFLFIVLNILFNKTLYNNIYLIPFYFMFIIACALTYTCICFIYTRNNTNIDGAIMIAMYSILLPFVLATIEEIFEFNYSLDYFAFTIYQPIGWVNTFFQSLMESNPYKFNLSAIIGLLFVIVLSVIFGILFVKLIKFDKSEDASSTSSSWFSYKTIVPIFTFIGAFAFDFLGAVIIAAIGSYMFYVIKNRSLKITYYELVTILISLVVGQVFNSLFV